MAPIIEIKNLTKRYGRRLAVEDLSLTVEEGDIYGFVGPNGAGKTSTIRILATLMRPNGGDVMVGGHSVRKNPREVRRAIGYMPDFFGVYADMKVWEYLDFFGACYKIPAPTRAMLIDDLLELVDLRHRREDMVDKLSRGMKQRLSLARTLIHDPQILILDEPASGLDPRARVEIRELLVELSRLGKTIFFSTHILSDVEEICTRVGIIEAGKLVAHVPVAHVPVAHVPVTHGRIEALEQVAASLAALPHRQVSLTVLGQAEEAEALLRNTPGVSTVERVPRANAVNGLGDTRTRFRVGFSGDQENVAGLLGSLVEAGIPVVQFSAENRDLEEVFMRVTLGSSARPEGLDRLDLKDW